METVEKLLAQIFERKNRIVRQVKQQTDNYTQHLASKCLVDGITPPPWLCYDNQSSDVPKELNKEDLIFEILLPHQRPTIRFPSACCSLYNEPVAAAGDNGELVDGFFRETSSYSKCFGSGDKQATAAGCLENNTGCTMNMVSELAVSITSPQDDAEARISNIYSAPDQSVARIQRSKSRQKALELRNSAKASGRSLLNQKYDTVGSPSRTRLPMFSSEQGQVTGSEEFGEPCVMARESCGDWESNERDTENMNKEKRTTFCTGMVRRSISYGEQPSSMKDLDNGDSFTCNLQKSGNSLRKDLHDFQNCPNVVNVSVGVINSAVNGESGSFIEARTEDHLEHKGKGRDTHVDRISRTSFSSPKPCLLDEAPEVDISMHPVMVEAGISAKRNRKSVQQFNDANNFLELSHKRTRSGTPAGDRGMSMLLDTFSSDHHGDTRSNSGAIEKSQATKYAVENSSDGILPFLDSRDANEMGNFGIVIVDDPVNNQSANPRSNIDDAALESLLTNPSDCVVFMEPKQLVFDDKEECNLKDKFRPTMEYEILERSPHKKFYNSLHSASLVDYQVISGDMISNKPSTVQPDVTKEDEIRQGFSESNNENVDVQMKQKESDEYEEISLNTFAVDSEKMLHIPDVKYTCLAMEPNEVENPCLENHVNTYAEEVCEPELHKEGNFSYKTKERSPRSSHSYGSKHFSKSDLSCPATKAIGLSEDCSVKEEEAPAPTDIIIDATGQHCPGENLNLSSAGAKLYSGNLNNEYGSLKVLGSSSLGGNDLLTPGSVGFPLDHESLDLSKSEEPKIAKKSVVQRDLRSLQVASWPKSKRRKIQDQEADSFSASPSFRVKKHYPSDLNSTIMNPKKAGDNIVSVPGHASLATDSTEKEVYQKIACQLIEEIEPSPKVQSEKNALNSKGHGELTETSSSSALKQLGEPIASNSMEDSARASQGCLFEEMNLAGASSSARREGDEGDSQYLLHHEGGDNLAYSEGLTMERSLLEGKSYLGDKGQPSCCLVSSSTKKDPNLTHPGEMLPVLESFIIEPQTENADVNISPREIDFDKFEFSRTSIERARILEQICKSTVMQTPLTQFSSALKVHGSQKFCHSVPNGLLECMDLRSTLSLNEDAHNQLRVIYGNNSDCNLQKMSYSDRLSYTEARFCWDSRNHYRSPVGKLWERMSQKTGSSEKRLGSNPELTCFPIEEDPSTSEEKENTSGVTEKIQEDNGLLNDTCAKRELLADITDANAATSFSAAEKFVNRATADFVSTEVSFKKGVHKKVKPKLQNYSRNKSVEKENDVLSIASNGIKKAKESTSSKFSKADALSKTTLKTERQKLSEKNPKYSNIVSNVTSFIPLVQQKQAAAVCTGKRDVKVKALEAAEVAKRLEQKRQNERKMRKEALKLERARIEQENLRQMELNNRKKDEERKKRDADIIAKKRLREEDKKEKERKKRQTEEARRLQKEEITLCSQKGGKDDIMKKSDNLLKKSQSMVQESRYDVMLEKPDNNTRPEELTVDFQQAAICTEACGTSGDSCQHQKTMPALDESAAKENSVVQKIPEKSYDISPYQCSDDEEEEEENIPNNKYIPSWASKNCVAFVLPMQQRIDPDVIFPLESFCTIDEVYPSPKAIRVMTKKGPR
ncbi:uncharacterized protein [Coffea arabica]|uniref:Inner centromere protein ARK-binding domain-containing protein n=1 Tax=Coffea arabica TaxID=13443 RepID=A0A6P6SB42_COFAR|nr:uncharacterized protein LOC113689764 [Coffea arabica]